MFGLFSRSQNQVERSAPRVQTLQVAAEPDDLLNLLQTIEQAAGAIYRQHGLPETPGHYRRPAVGGDWEHLGASLSPAEKWALIDAAGDTPSRWRFASYEALGSHSDIPAVQRASALLAACRGLRLRIAQQDSLTAQDLADAIRIGEGWHRLIDPAPDAPETALKAIRSPRRQP